MAAVDVGVGISGPSAASAAGGGNVFNAAPLWGSVYGQTASSNGDNGASAAATSAASGKGAVPLSNVGTALPTSGGTGAAASISSYLPFLLIGAAGLVLVFGAIEIFKIFKK